ncbi:DUF4336 domain-containing protein [Alloalcanivorax marinus]|uniref:DUF4336 domain-containing protein n=1 Tax=Alloalcanivorax marinus TaxID=1177169 RepID=UPI001931C198|nr:DUF4336 domain-containing protein [Alloalcanivorax marinus]MBL7250412.1 DUF4336 domain-containing protein [Alloalcanivorax marinus]
MTRSPEQTAAAHQECRHDIPVQVGEDLWLVDGPVVDFYRLSYPTRSVIARLPDGGLWVWSPVPLTPALRAFVDDLGPVRYLISPNKLHHLYLGEWQQAWPDAELWGPRSTQRKRTDLTFTGTLGDTAPPAWADALDQIWLREALFLDEVVFFHRPSRTVILADFSEAFSDDFLRRHWKPWQRWIARLWGITERPGKAPLEVRLSTLRRRRARQRVRRMLAWQPEKVIMAHGVWRAENGTAFLRQVFSWLNV